jgi:hypothetical protein
VEPELAEAFKHTARSSILKRSGQTGSDHTDLVLLHGFFPTCCSSPGSSPSPKNDRVRTGHRISSHVNSCRRQPWNHIPTSNIKSSTYTECAKQKKTEVSTSVLARRRAGRPIQTQARSRAPPIRTLGLHKTSLVDGCGGFHASRDACANGKACFKTALRGVVRAPCFGSPG